ncbi:hypothetical protein [Francisella persica]|uniref:hypothetical protein n=1 Tax=Francisella persica TaxID=954 RepID=UPI000AEF0D2E|nr:hypothetical protein [Francisella persica]
MCNSFCSFGGFSSESLKQHIINAKSDFVITSWLCYQIKQNNIYMTAAIDKVVDELILLERP